jgi:hypothetical protein
MMVAMDIHTTIITIRSFILLLVSPVFLTARRCIYSHPFYHSCDVRRRYSGSPQAIHKVNLLICQA